MVIFKDKSASFGRARLSNPDKTIISATSPSRSLDSLIPKDKKSLKIEILENGYLILDFSSVIGTKVKVSKTNAKKLSEWIKLTYEQRTGKVKEANLARKSKSS